MKSSAAVAVASAVVSACWKCPMNPENCGCGDVADPRLLNSVPGRIAPGAVWYKLGFEGPVRVLLTGILRMGVVKRGSCSVRVAVHTWLRKPGSDMVRPGMLAARALLSPEGRPPFCVERLGLLVC